MAEREPIDTNACNFEQVRLALAAIEQNFVALFAERERLRANPATVPEPDPVRPT